MVAVRMKYKKEGQEKKTWSWTFSKRVKLRSEISSEWNNFKGNGKLEIWFFKSFDAKVFHVAFDPPAKTHKLKFINLEFCLSVQNQSEPLRLNFGGGEREWKTNFNEKVNTLHSSFSPPMTKFTELIFILPIVSFFFFFILNIFGVQNLNLV